MSNTAVSNLNTPSRVNSPDPFPPRPRPSESAHLIRTDAEALAVAEQLAAEFAQGAALRDREGILPITELDAFSQSGLWGITVPRSYGGAEVSYVTLSEVIKIIAAADPSLGQIPQNHLAVVALIHLEGGEPQKQWFYSEVLRGIRFSNAFSEGGNRKVTDFQTRITRDGDDYVVHGEKFYSTGALFAHIIPIVGLDEYGNALLAFVERNAPGLRIINDWSSFGQRTTASGTVISDRVRVPAGRVLAVHRAFDRPTAAGPIAQIIQAAVDAGIARGAIHDTIEFVKTHTRPWMDSGQRRSADDPYTIAAIGDLKIKLHAAEEILARAGRLIDTALAAPDDATVAAAAVGVAEAKVLTTEIAILSTNKLFELGGTRSTLATHHLDRHWRNARTHTLHDPVRWKFHAVGNYYLNGINPPCHAWL